MERKIISVNRKAFHEYHLFDKYSAGLVLTGTEIKSIRKGAVNLKDSFCKIFDGEIWLYNCHIGKYDEGNRYNHEERRPRKLLLHKKEIEKMLGKIKKDGFAIIPVEMYLTGGWAKIDISLAKGKKLYDKREASAKKDQNREMQRAVKKRA